MQISVKFRIGKVAVTKYGEFVDVDIKITAVPFGNIDNAMLFTIATDLAGGVHTNFALNPLNDNPMEFDDILELNPELDLFNGGRVIFDYVKDSSLNPAIPT